MADDRKPRRAVSHRDFAHQRAKTEPGMRLDGRALDPNRGVPVEVDPELTPPPREPPREEQFDTMPPAVQIRTLRNVVAEQGAAIDRVWDARHVSDRLAKVEQIVAEDTKQVTRLIVEVNQWAQTSKEALGKSIAISENQVALDTRLGVFFDEQFPEFVDSLKGFVGTLNSVSGRVSDNEAAIDDIATVQKEHALELASLDGRVRTIELEKHNKGVIAAERRRWLTWGKTAYAVAATVAAAAIGIAGYLAGTNL